MIPAQVVFIERGRFLTFIDRLLPGLLPVYALIDHTPLIDSPQRVVVQSNYCGDYRVWLV